MIRFEMSNRKLLCFTCLNRTIYTNQNSRPNYYNNSKDFRPKKAFTPRPVFRSAVAKVSKNEPAKVEPVKPKLNNLDWGKDKFPYKAAYCCTERQVEEQLAEFNLNGPVSFDMEWTILFRKGAQQPKTALIQLANQEKLLLVHLSKMDSMPSLLLSILENPNVHKFGMNIVADAQKLYRDYGVAMKGMVDLQHIAGVFDKEFAQKRKKSLKALVEHFLGRTLDKDKKPLLMNWNKEHLLPEQLAYASNDVYASDLLLQTFTSRCQKYKMDINQIVRQLACHAEVGEPKEENQSSCIKV